MPEPEINNPVLPVAPPKGTEKQAAEIQSFNESFQQNAGKIIAQQAQNPYVELQPAAFDPKSTTDINKNYERYYSHPSFKRLGFNPWSDNESTYNQQGSDIGDVARAAKAGFKLAATGFKAPIRSYADLFSGDTFETDDASAQEMKYYNTVGASNKGGGTGFASNLIVNSGFSIGFIGEAIAEQAALTGLTYLTGGGTSGAQIARAAKTVKDFGSYAKVVEGLTNAAKALNNYPASKIAYDSFKAVGKFINPLENTLNALNGSKNLTDLAKISNTAAGFFRDVSAANFTLAEAKVEGAAAEQDMEQELIREFKARPENNGRGPSYQELIQIKDAAKTAGDKTLAFNIPAIFLTNKITFAPLFKNFTNSGEYILKNGIKFIEKDGTLIQATLADQFKTALKPKNLAKLPITYFKENTSEGIQELSQEIVSGAAKKYYTDIYNSSVNQGITFAQAENQNFGTWDAISQGVKNQFSGKGFETFASGFFMGGLLKIAGAPITAARMGFSDYKKTKNEYAERTLEAANALYKDPLKYFAPQTINYSSTANGVENQNQAEDQDDQKAWTDFEDQNTWAHITTALDTGTYDVALEKLRSIKTMSPEAIQEAYGQDGQQVLSKIDRIIARAENLKTNYDKWNERASNPFNPKAFKNNTPEYNREAIGFISWEAAKKSAIFQDFSFNRNTQRISSLNNDILQTEEFNKFNPNDISILLDPRALRTELGLLDNELEILSDSSIPGDRAKLKASQTKRSRLADFQESLQNYYVTQQFDNLSQEEKDRFDKSGTFKKTSQAQLKKDYKNYIKHLGNQAGVFFGSDPNLDSSFNQLLDIHDLKQENIQFSQAINILSNPKGFTDHYKALFDTFSDLYSTREETIRKSIEDSQKKIELNVGLLKPLYERGFVVDSKDLDALIDKGTIPNQFYDINAKQVVNSSDPFRYGKFRELVNNYKEATQPEAPVEEPVVVQEETVPENPEVVVEKGTVEITPEAQHFIDLYNKIDKVDNKENFDRVEGEISSLMLSIHIDDYNASGLTLEAIRTKLRNKLQQLSSEVTLKNLKSGNIVALNERDILGKNKKAIIKKIGNDYLILGALDISGLEWRVNELDLKKEINSKYSDIMKSDKIIPTPQEVEKTKENITKTSKFVDNNRDVLEKLLADALANEVEFEQEFVNNLGCK